jgi:hypothetical protein
LSGTNHVSCQGQVISVLSGTNHVSCQGQVISVLSGTSHLCLVRDKSSVSSPKRPDSCGVPHIQWLIWTLSPGVHWPGREVDYSPSCLAQDKNEWSYTSNLP